MQPIIDIEELKNLDQEIILIDVRGGADTRQRYMNGHLPGAQFVDLDKDLSAVPADAANGGRHPLPSTADFAALLSRLGIDPQTHVVVYDDKAGAMGGARFWWMMKSIGHQQIQHLSGGLQAAVDDGLELSTNEEAVPEPKVYPVPAAFTGMVDIETAGVAAQNTNKMVIDVRETPRYLGHTEPIDLVAGHIPGAVNIPYSTNFGEGNRFLSAGELRLFYDEKLNGTDPVNVIVHCGSGVTACHTLLALEQAGIKGAQLYVGSWSEWSRRGMPIAKEV
jgi:thiosulfate/3-mercaptopyruvate sulfurtransferase